MTEVRARQSIDPAMVLGLVIVRVAIACGGEVEAGSTAVVGSVGGGAAGVGGSAVVGGGTATSEPTYFELTPGQRDSLTSGICNELKASDVDVPLAVSFLVDTSASMLEASAASSGALRWTLAHDAASLAIDILRPIDDAALVLFPNQVTLENSAGDEQPAARCVNFSVTQLPTEIGNSPSGPRAKLRDVLNGVTPGGATPLFDAYRIATEPLASTKKLAYVVMITDGRATMTEGCQGSGTEALLVETQSTIDAIAKSQAEGIGTIVASTVRNAPAVVSSNEVRDWLSNAATAGGAAIPSSCSPSGNPKYCHVDLTQGTSGVADLVRAVGQRPACTIALAAATPALLNAAAMYLLYDTPTGNSLLYLRTDASCPFAEGYYLDEAVNSVVLCPASCQHVQRDPFGSMTLFATCPIQSEG